jgi:hypothetical protein
MASVEDTLAREIIKSLDGVQAWLAQISGLLQEGLGGQGQVIVEQQGRIQSLLELLVSMALPSGPSITREVTINAVTPTPLAFNESLMFQRFTITNDDPAQMCWLGDSGVLPSMGRVLLAQTTIDYVLPRGASVYAICAVATISVRVSEGYDFVSLAQALQP